MLYGLPSGFLGTFLGWLFSGKKRRNDFLKELQNSIDLLTAKYTEVLDKYTVSQAENAQLKLDNAQLLANQQIMAQKIDALNKKIDQLNKLLKSQNNEKFNQGLSHITACRTCDGVVRNEKASGDDFTTPAADHKPLVGNRRPARGRTGKFQPSASGEGARLPDGAQDGDPGDTGGLISDDDTDTEPYGSA